MGVEERCVMWCRSVAVRGGATDAPCVSGGHSSQQWPGGGETWRLGKFQQCQQTAEKKPTQLQGFGDQNSYFQQSESCEI